MLKFRSGFSLVETLLALLIVSLAAMLLVRSSAANAIALAQATKRSDALRLMSEFSVWTRLDGHLALGMPLDEVLAESGAHPDFCHDGDCSAEQGAWHYVSRWRERLSLAIPDARIEICIDESPLPEFAGWSCKSQGSAWVMKLGWPPRSSVAPTFVVELALVS